MSSLNFAGDSGSLSDINLTQGLKRSQIAALNDLMKQIAGNAAVSAGNTAQADPLNSPFELFVNPYIGSDEFVGGSYNDYEEGTDAATRLASKLKRLEKQRLTCGFSPQRPFKTINRAVIEAAIITSKNWYTDYSDAGQVDCVSIKLSSGVHTVYNNPGDSSLGTGTGKFNQNWSTSYTPTTDELAAFNPPVTGGILLPRGCSLKGDDLRKISLRPTYVPTSADETDNYSNRAGILKITGTGYYFGFTFLDKINNLTSHHLLDAFQFASKAELDLFYSKCESAVGTGADLSSALIKTRSTEYQIVGPIDITESPTSAWDTTKSASPYIFNVSVRSEYGMGGAFMDGAKNEGLSSMVCANFTGVSLQKDMSCWQIYSNGTWTNLANTEAAYETYINTEPDNVRMDPKRLSRHISAINNAVIQEVSVFSIGHGVQHFTDLGGEVTITNSNSSFGGCSALSKGYKTFSFPQDKNWSVAKIEVPLNLSEKTNNIQRIYLGTVSAISDTLITLTSGLEIASNSTTIPNVLYKDGYSLKHNTRVWVENPLGADWQTSLTASAWSSSSPTLINVTAALAEGNSAGTAPGTNPDTGNSLAVGKRVYIRRLADTRTPSERRMALQLTNTSSARIPERNFVLQTDPSRASGAISRELDGGGAEVFTVESSGVGSETGVTKSAAITVRRAAPDVSYSNGGFFRAGTVVKHANKHFQALRDQTTTTATPSPNDWAETFVHMPEDYCAEDNRLNTAPILVIDTDTDSTDTSTTLGINFTTGWTTAGDLRTQYESGTDYQGVYAFLIALGFSASNAMNSLKPQAEANRKLDPVNQLTGEPSGGAATAVGNWAVEFRRPSVLRLFAHSWEFNGALNYSKALPAAQKTIGPQNKFTYYFTNEAGGRVVPQGSNEEGFNITPRGLEDVETGATISVENIDNSTIDDTQIIDFPDLRVDNLTINTAVSFPENAKATGDDRGIVSLAKLTDLEDPPTLTTDEDLDATAVTPKGLRYWQGKQRLVQSLPSGVPYALLHVASSKANALTGNNSIPFGLKENSDLEWSATGNVFHETIFTSLTAAVEKASQLFLPTGSTVVISIHDDLVNDEAGPIQLVNGFAQFNVLGARGTAATTPTIHMKRGTTANACDRIPQYAAVEAFSAGAIFGDLTLKLDCNGVGDISATFNGGFAVGGRDMITEWSNVGTYFVAATCNYGGTIDLQFRSNGTPTSKRYLTNIVKSKISTGNNNTEPKFIFLGSNKAGSGLTGHGCDLRIDFEQPNSVHGLKFSHDLTAGVGGDTSTGNLKLSLLDLGGRGGVKTGTRFGATLDYNFDNKDFNLVDIIGSGFLLNQNYQGRSFKTVALSSSSASSSYGINSTSLATIVAVQLQNGCCADASSDADVNTVPEPLQSGFLGILAELEKDTSIVNSGIGLLLTAQNSTNSFIYNSRNSARNVT